MNLSKVRIPTCHRHLGFPVSTLYFLRWNWGFLGFERSLEQVVTLLLLQLLTPTVFTNEEFHHFSSDD